MPPRVSFVIPSYNAAATIRATIESVLCQTYRDFEVLVVDDGSTDETAAVVRSFEPEVRYLYQPNQGLAAARNAGIRATTGEVLVLLDADDIWLPDLLERQVAILTSKPEIDGVYAWVQYVDEHGTLLPDQMQTVLDGDILRRLLLGGNCVLSSMLAVRRRTFERVGLFDPAFRQAQDWDMMLRMAIAGVRFACIPRPLVLRRQHAHNLSADPDRSLHWGRVVLHKAFTSLQMPERYRTLAPQAHFNILHRAAMTHWRSGDRPAALALLVEAVTLWPKGLRRPQVYITTLSRLQPSGYRSREEILGRLDILAEQMKELLRSILSAPDLPRSARRSARAAWSALHAVLAMCFAQNHRWDRAAGHAVKSITLRPGLVLDVAANQLQSAVQRLGPVLEPVQTALEDSDEGQS